MRRRSIIVAEDDRHMRDWFVKLLCSRGARVQAVGDGWELLVALCRNLALGETVDLVVSDLYMPRATGLQVLDAARSFGLRTPFLLVTGSADLELRAVAEGLRASVLDKPFSADAFLTRVHELCIAPPMSGGTLARA